MSKVFIVCELGINHNGNINIAKQLIAGAKSAGCDAVKFQKRTIELCYSQDELNKYRESPWGVTNRTQKQGLEFITENYDEIDKYCKEINVDWFASAWDLASISFLKKYNCKYNKVASARLGHEALLTEIAKEGKYTFIATGMSTLDEIRRAVAIFNEYKCPIELLHCNSAYPADAKDLNLLMIPKLRELFPDIKVGYSGHEVGLSPSVAAVALGATTIERHITLDRSMYGSDQSASVEVQGFERLVKMIREVEVSLGDGEKRITEAEMKCREKLWRSNDY